LNYCRPPVPFLENDDDGRLGDLPGQPELYLSYVGTLRCPSLWLVSRAPKSLDCWAEAQHG